MLFFCDLVTHHTAVIAVCSHLSLGATSFLLVAEKGKMLNFHGIRGIQTSFVDFIQSDPFINAVDKKKLVVILLQ